MDVALVRWPEDEDKRRELRAANRPRVLLVDEKAPPPVSGDPLEDWIRLPADDRDLRARLDALTLRSGAEVDVFPEIDRDGLLRMSDQWVSLPPIEQRLATALLDKPSAVVSRDALAKAGWPGESATRNALDVHMLRLRRRIEPLGLSIRTVRSRGYVLDVKPPVIGNGARDDQFSDDSSDERKLSAERRL
jgi:DNA-binding winged helix-turn-helix (wHTH) protein